MRKVNIFLTILTLFAFLIRLFPLDLSYFFWDEVVYLMIAQYFSEGFSYYLEVFSRPILMPFLLSFFSNFEIMGRILMSFFSALLVPVSYLIGNFFNRKTGVISAIFIAFLPFNILAGSWIMTDSLASLFFVFSVYCYLMMFKRKKFIWAVFAGISFGLGIMTKFTVLYLFIVLIPLVFYYRKEFMLFLYSILFLFLSLLPYFIFNYINFGNIIAPFLSASNVIVSKGSISLGFLLLTVFDFFGPVLLVLFLLSLFKFKKRFSYLFLIYWAFLGIAYYFLIMMSSIDKIIPVWWESERFLFFALFPIVILSGYVLSKISVKKIILVIVLFLLLSIPGYYRSVIPAIEFEDGLREVTKDIGLYIKDSIPENEIISCIGNCPVIAYYSERKVNILSYSLDYDYSRLNEGSYFVITSNNLDLDYNMIHKESSGSWVSILYVR